LCVKDSILGTLLSFSCPIFVSSLSRQNFLSISIQHLILYKEYTFFLRANRILSAEKKNTCESCQIQTSSNHSTYFRSAAQDPQSCHLGIPGNSILNLKTEIQLTTIDCVLHYFIISLEDQKMRIEEKTSRRAGTFPDRGIRR